MCILFSELSKLEFLNLPAQAVNCRCIPDTSGVEQRRPVADYNTGVDEFLPCEDQQPLCSRGHQVSSQSLSFGLF